MAKRSKKDEEKKKAEEEQAALDNLKRELFCRYYAQGEGTFGNATLSYAAAYDIDLGDLSRRDMFGNTIVPKEYKGNYRTIPLKKSGLK